MVKRSPTKRKLRLSDQLILNQYMLNQFEVESFDSLTKDLKEASLEELDVDNISRFYKQLTSRLVQRQNLNDEILRQYDENIVRFTLEISQHREERIKWKYFQYLSLLFTEIYLDKYFNQRERLLIDLNTLVAIQNKELAKKDHLSEYVEDDLRKLAFWNATGSGKTLLMHVNIKQYLHYFSKKHRPDELANIILLTPSEDLSIQHEKEFVKSGMRAGLFDKTTGALFKGQEISIIDIHKIKDEMGEKTVAVGAFEGNNLVLVDEGHRGSSGDEWKTKREQLSESGFAFEYSATFGQAVAKKKDLIDEYSKCILFDYSYRYFHADGYGKEYQILNLQDDKDEKVRHLYLVACLLSFYQQLKIYTDNEISYRPFFVEKPLWVFVGGSVNALRKQQGRTVSDVTDVLLFIARFVKEENESIGLLKSLLSGKPGLLDDKEQEIFKNAFTYLASLNKSAEEIYFDTLKILFNSSQARTTLRVEKLKGQEGELSLRLGENDPFGVINVGDAAQLWKLCEEYPELLATERDFSESYFHKIDEKDSSINILIGSKKFTEGWSSWRVSTMGLMNMGRSEGSQIIQLFGRGVRLKGYEFSLKRSDALKGLVPEVPNFKYLKYIETLNIFGIHADYMQQFKEYLEEEGIKTEVDFEEFMLPVILNYQKRKVNLKALRLKDGINFKKQGPKPILSTPSEPVPSSQKVIINWYPKIQFRNSLDGAGKMREVQMAVLNETTLKKHHIAFMDMESIYFEMQRFKNERTWYNLVLSKEKIVELLIDQTWYKLQIPERELEFSDFSQVKRWEEIAIALLKKYCEKQYLNAKKAFEAPHMEYYELDENDKNFINEYQVYADKESEEGLIEELKKLKNALENKQLLDIEFGQFKSFSYGQHLYEPLLSFDGNSTSIRIKPVALNEEEYLFLKDLKIFYEKNKGFFKDKELYVLRNQSRGRGIGFFEAGNFHPDFILWMLYNNKQYITFADPKGIRNLSITDPKLVFYQTIKEMEARLGDDSVILNSFIISNTYFADLINTGTTLPKEEMESRNILFQFDDRETYIDTMIKKIIEA
ncbi:DEAD/DEAH box helicase family protein [Sporosarcina sp. ACRSL]|uniref:DEAD/DEAH box helicase family protein n=1 Tax=Sporosarcina sp. ACRSL TaxID=2918215 RepID=UPI001EF6FE93|nr:DEAD/DEAH box helicase family protein [Sporosarcina sp. ACRSL]MCG7344776.1 DEAD/DEAH box helicase family protein [Sporosarcina sp. ACRSL]